MINVILEIIRQRNTKMLWRKKNKHNETSMINIFNVNNVFVGKATYGGLNVLTFNDQQKLEIGNFCSIAPGVVFILSGDHFLNNISTFPFKVKIVKSQRTEAISKGDIIVGDDVWIGQNAIIMSGVHIGQGAVISAGAVVTKDVEPYSIVGGVPAKKIKYRFEHNIIEEMMKIDYSKLDDKLIQKHIDELYSEVNNLEQIAWLPKK